MYELILHTCTGMIVRICCFWSVYFNSTECEKNTEEKDIVMKMFLLLTLYHVLFLCNLILDLD